MKKYLLVFILLLTVITGCKLDNSTFPDGVPAGGAGTIIGKWDLKTIHTVGTALGFPVDGTDSGTANDYYIFRANSTMDVSSEDDGLSTGTYTYNASTRKLTTTQGTETLAITITSLTADAMVLTYPISVPAIGTSLTITATYKR